MALTTRLRTLLNAAIGPFGFKLETRRADEIEVERLRRLEQTGYFSKPAFPVPPVVRDSDWRKVIDALTKFQLERGRLESAHLNDVGFSNNNPFFHPPDSDVLYVMMREYQPSRVIEIGSGNSTRIMRQAIRDGGLSTKVVSIDPLPRSDVKGFADEIRAVRVEEIPAEQISADLNRGDFLFIDSSHMTMVGNDVVLEFLQVIPQLKSGVMIHVHDIFLPWDYPLEWINREPQVGGWSEQHILQAMLWGSDRFDVLWPGHYVQRLSGTDFDTHFPNRHGAHSTSFWMRVK